MIVSQYIFKLKNQVVFRFPYKNKNKRTKPKNERNCILNESIIRKSLAHGSQGGPCACTCIIILVYFVREKIYVVLDLEGIFLPPLLDPAWPPRSPSMKLFFTKTMMSSQSTSQDESFVLECKKFLRGLCLLLFMATKSPQYDSFFQILIFYFKWKKHVFHRFK